MHERTEIRVGCCGFALAQARYFRRFPLVEVQQTFYDPPRPQTLRRWRRQAPRAFEFTLKAWQLITHDPSSPTYRRLRKPVPRAARERYGFFRPTAQVQEAWWVTLECARALEARIIVFQCPAAFTPTAEHIRDLRAFFRAARKDASAGMLFGWEPRGDWPRALVARLCRELGLLYVVDPFRQPPLPGRVRYFRLHGRTGYRYRYTDADLRALHGFCRGRATCYCLFNNLSMAEDAQRFLRLLGRSRAPA